MNTHLNKKAGSRRKFLEQLALIGVALPWLPSSLKAAPAGILHKKSTPRIDSISVFSKHLQFLNYDDSARVAAEIGFDGLDLTVRPEGHVLPENVETDLPKAVEAARKAGINVPTITTSITSVTDPFAEKILATASGLGIRHYRMGWVEYDHSRSLLDNLDNLVSRFRSLAQMNKKYGIVGDYQNHAGAHMGSPVWDIFRVLESLDPEWIGSQYDIRHASCEGGNCWPLGLELIHNYIHTVVVKDFYWKNINGKWREFDTPVGEGMVNFQAYFDQLKKLGVSAAMIMHFEYPLSNKPDSMLPVADTIAQVKANMKKDLETVRGLIAAAGIEYK